MVFAFPPLVKSWCKQAINDLNSNTIFKRKINFQKYIKHEVCNPYWYGKNGQHIYTAIYASESHKTIWARGDFYPKRREGQ